MQIARFFQQNKSITQEQCNAEAQRLTGSSVSPTPSQGGSSYTVESGGLVVQFRPPNSRLDIDMLQMIESAYHGFVPRHEEQGQFGDLHVYTMNNMGGTCMYLARDDLLRNDCYLLRFTLDDYARFFVSAFRNTSILMDRPQPDELYSEYMSKLEQLRVGLPQRFHATLDNLTPKVADLFDESWPLVPNHTDLLENNIHVDPATGKITGICDWRETQVGPFGMSLAGLEVMLGIAVTSGSGWRYHPNHQALRSHFWARFYHYLGDDVSDVEKQRIETARLVGLFMTYAFEYGVPATEQSPDLRILGALILE